MIEEALYKQNQELIKELENIKAKYSVCLECFGAMINYDHTGIVEQTLKELEKIDEQR